MNADHLEDIVRQAIQNNLLANQEIESHIIRLRMAKNLLDAQISMLLLLDQNMRQIERCEPSARNLVVHDEHRDRREYVMTRIVIHRNAVREHLENLYEKMCSHYHIEVEADENEIQNGG